MIPAIDPIPFGPWVLVETLFACLVFITLGKFAVVVLSIIRDIGRSLFETVLAAIHAFRQGYREGYEGVVNNNRGGDDDDGGRQLHQAVQNYQDDQPVADGGAHEPPGNVPWPPENAFEEDER